MIQILRGTKEARVLGPEEESGKGLGWGRRRVERRKGDDGAVAQAQLTAGARAEAYGTLLPARLLQQPPQGPLVTLGIPAPSPGRPTLLTSKGPGKGCVGLAPRARFCCLICPPR